MPEEPTTPSLTEPMERASAALNARDFDAAASFYAPDALLYPRAASVFEGREAIGRFFEDWFGAYEEFAFELEECRDLGNGVVFAVISQQARLAGSAAWIPEERSALVLTGTDGLIEKETNFSNVDEGRVAAERLARRRGGG